jgi:nitroreductase
MIADRNTHESEEVMTASKVSRGGALARGRAAVRAAKSAVRVASGPLAREGRLVRAGIDRYEGHSNRSEAVYQLRRNVHMLEKGLTMRPRRPVFGMDYIKQTVETFVTLRGRVDSPLGRDETLWMNSVLADYFDATREASDDRHKSLEATFVASGTGTSDERSHGPHHPELAASPVEPENLLALARGRRSVRWFQPRPVSRDIVDRAMAVAVEGPTACNRQPYRYLVFDDAASVKKVAAIPMGTRGYADQLTGIVVVVGDMSAFFDPRDRHLIYIDGCLASMGLILGLESEGVGTCVINWPDMPEKEREMRDLLHLAEYEKVIMLIAYGYADPEGLVPFSAKAELGEVRSFVQLP